MMLPNLLRTKKPFTHLPQRNSTPNNKRIQKTFGLTLTALAMAMVLQMLFLQSCSDTELVSMKQLNNGVKLYKTHCSNCHQEDGSGLAQLIPPLKNSDYLKQNATQLPCLIQQGMQGKIEVNGTMYQLPMPANKQLSKEEMKDLCRFVYQKFLADPTPITDSMLEQYLQNCPPN
jgi:mono/diheme cytochrome c family protein